MVNEAEPGVQVSDVVKCWKMADCIVIFLDFDFKSSKFHCISFKDKLGRVEGESMSPTEVELVNSLVKTLAYVQAHISVSSMHFVLLGTSEIISSNHLKYPSLDAI